VIGKIAAQRSLRLISVIPGLRQRSHSASSSSAIRHHRILSDMPAQSPLCFSSLDFRPALRSDYLTVCCCGDDPGDPRSLPVLHERRNMLLHLPDRYRMLMQQPTSCIANGAKHRLAHSLIYRDPHFELFRGFELLLGVFSYFRCKI